MPPLSFTDSQLDQVFAGAAPLPASDHDAYLQTVADLLHGVAEPGDEDVHLAVAEAQHEAVKMYARFFKKRYGRSASKRVRVKAEEFKRKADLRGHEVWNDVAREMEQSSDTSSSGTAAGRENDRPRRR